MHANRDLAGRKMVIRIVEEKDVADLVNLIKKDLGYADAKEDFIRNQILKLDTNREAVFVAEIDEFVVGFIHVEKYSNIYFGPVGNILGLAVRESFRNQGIGKQLLATAENWSKGKGCIGMRLNSGGSRINAHDFYRSQGYNSEKTQIRFMKIY